MSLLVFLNNQRVCSVRKFPPFRSERKKRSTSEGTPQFPNGISGKLPYHLTSNRNFRIFWPNGKHPRYQTTNLLKCRDQGYLPFTRDNRKFQLENQMVRAIPFGKLQKIWAVIYEVMLFFCSLKSL